MCYTAIADSNIQIYFDIANISETPSQVSEYVRHYSRSGPQDSGPIACRAVTK